ncbi:unnamed protein product [Pylaiella littoralis]
MMEGARGVERQHKREQRSRNVSDRRRIINSSTAAAAAAALSYVCLLGAASAADPGLPDGYKVVHANVVLRHGERSRLVKTTASEFGDNDGVVLTPEGEEEMYSLGTQLRQRYMPLYSNNDSTTQIEGLTLWYDAERVQVVSSGYDRTIESATALAFGLYPIGQSNGAVDGNSLLWDNQIVVPVHSSNPDNDAIIVAADKCPAYDDAWQETYRLTDVQEMQDLADEAQGDKDGYITQVFNEFEKARTANNDPDCWAEVLAFYNDKLQLHGPYNLWDCARTLFAEGSTQTVDYIEVAEIPDEFSSVHPDVVDGWHFLEYLVYWVEDRKFEQEVVGRMVGGLYLTAMNTRMSQVVSHIRSGYSDTEGRYPGMHITAGHYSTLKGVAGALDIGGLEGIPGYGSHFSFELLHIDGADTDAGEDDFAVRIMYQNSTSKSDLMWTYMGIVFDGSGSLDVNETLVTERDMVNGIMGWEQWSYLMLHQLGGDPAIYTGGHEEWCLDCVADKTTTCLELDLRLMTQRYEDATVDTQVAQAETEEVDDGIGGVHVALVSIFGIIFGIGVGLCMKPCLDKYTNGGKGGTVHTTGDRGLEAWSQSNNGTNGSFRLGAKSTGPSRHVMGAVRSNQMVPVPTDDAACSPTMNGANGNGNGNAYDYDVEEDEGDSRIPEFAPTSALGEPVPFPHQRQPSGMLSGVDADMGTDVDGRDVSSAVATDGAGDGDSRELLEFR